MNPVGDMFFSSSLPDAASAAADLMKSDDTTGRCGRTKSRYRSFSEASFLSFAGFSSSSANRFSSPYQRSLSSWQRSVDSSSALPHISDVDDLVTMSGRARKYSLDS